MYIFLPIDAREEVTDHFPPSYDTFFFALHLEHS